MKQERLVLSGWCCMAVLAFGCNSGREVEVTGQVTAPSTLAVGDKLVLQIIDVTTEGETRHAEVVDTAELAKLGGFERTVDLEGDRAIVRVIDDRDGDGKCTAGEAWAESEAGIASDKLEGVSLMLAVTPCPVG